MNRGRLFDNTAGNAMPIPVLIDNTVGGAANCADKSMVGTFLFGVPTSVKADQAAAPPTVLCMGPL